MSRIVVALVIWLYFMRIINYCALKVVLEITLSCRTETAVLWNGDA